jgi:hypothetical protein
VDTAAVDGYAAENGFEPKPEYHLTIIGSRNIVENLRQILEVLNPEAQQKLKAELDNLSTLLGDIQLKEGQYHHLGQQLGYGDAPETRESIIQEVEVIDEFYSGFTQITGIELGTPFPRLTLFTKGADGEHQKGIGISSAEAFSTIEHKPILT